MKYIIVILVIINIALALFPMNSKITSVYCPKVEILFKYEKVNEEDLEEIINLFHVSVNNKNFIAQTEEKRKMIL